MKIYMNTQRPKYVYNLDIVFNYLEYIYEDELVAASEENKEKDLEIQNELEEIDSDWDEFIINTLEKFNYYNFDVVNEHRSDNKESNSYYVSFYPIDKGGTEINDVLLNLRISDHYIKIKAATYTYYDHLAQEYKKSGDRKQRFELQNIVVGSRSLPDIESASDYLEYMCKELYDGGEKNLRKLLNKFCNSCQSEVDDNRETEADLNAARK